jgi:hypothetical protein
MKSSSSGNGKKVAGLILASALVIGSLGTAAALAVSGTDAVPKDTVMTAPAAPSPSEAAVAPQGTIEYSTDAYSRADGSQDFTIERWFDPATKDMRSDLKEFNSDHQVTRYQSTYYLGGNEIIIIQRDLNNGNALSGTIMTREDQPTLFLKIGGFGGFDQVKSSFTDTRWTSIGTEQTSDGKTLTKMAAEIYQSYISDTTQANMQLIMFIDQETGLPVKEELYEDSTGSYKLFSTDTNEYKYVADDGTIFKVPDIDLTPFQGPSETLGK